MIEELVRSLLAAVFLALLWRVYRCDGAGRRRRVEQLCAYALTASLLSGLSQWDAWPFSDYRLAAYLPRRDREICFVRFFGVSADGSEWQADPYTWSPLYDQTLQTWFRLHWPALEPEEQERVMAFLASKMEAARTALERGQPIGYARRLGAAHLPYWSLLPHQPAVPSEPYVALRVYDTCRTPEGWWERGEAWRRERLIARWPD